MSTDPRNGPDGDPDAGRFDDLADQEWEDDEPAVARYVWRAEEIPGVDGVSNELVGRRIAVLGIGQAQARELVTRLERHGAEVVRVPPARRHHRHPSHGDPVDGPGEQSAPATTGPRVPGEAPTPSTGHSVPAGSAAPAGSADGGGGFADLEHASTDDLAELLVRAGRPVDGIIDLGVGTTDVVEAGEAWAAQFAQTLDALRVVAPVWAQAANVRRHFYAPVLRTGGYLGTQGHVEHPHGGMWAGLAKGLPRELPNLNLRIIDFPPDTPPYEVAEATASELYRWGLFEVGRVRGRRFTPAAKRSIEPPPTLRLSSADTVLLSGGGRGIGFELALDLAVGLGVRVVVTGRGPAPDEHDEILALTDEGFARYRTERLRQAGLTGTVRAVRRHLDSIAREREVVTNLERARAAGARVEYRQCDVTDAGDVDALVAELSGSLAVVVHNAGFDAPARLATKTNEDAEAIIRVKLDGLLNLLAAVDRHADPDVFSVVGSLTGRWGGMVGQLDYGAANEVASYFARWAGTIAPAGMSIHALAWPTWERLGMVSNYEATLAYMDPMPVDLGIELWRSEILGRAEGEVAFHAAVGPALTPTLVRGYSARSELPGMAGLGTVVARCGDVSSFAPGQEFATRVQLTNPGDSLHLDVDVDGAPSVPISVLVDQLTASAAWVVSGAARFVPVGVDSLCVDIPALAKAATEPCEVIAHRIGRHAAEAGQVDLVTVTASCGADLVASADIRFALDYPPTTSDNAAPSEVSGLRGCLDGAELDSDAQADGGAGACLTWHGFAFDLAARNGAAAGPDRLRDQFAPGPVPVAAFGYNTLESLVRLTYPGGPVRRFWLEGLRVTAPADQGAGALVTVTPRQSTTSEAAGSAPHAPHRPQTADVGSNVGVAEGVSWSAATIAGDVWLTAAAAGFEPGRGATDTDADETDTRAPEDTATDSTEQSEQTETADSKPSDQPDNPDNPADVREFA